MRMRQLSVGVLLGALLLTGCHQETQTTKTSSSPSTHQSQATSKAKSSASSTEQAVASSSSQASSASQAADTTQNPVSEFSLVAGNWNSETSALTINEDGSVAGDLSLTVVQLYPDGRADYDLHTGSGETKRLTFVPKGVALPQTYFEENGGEDNSDMTRDRLIDTSSPILANGNYQDHVYYRS